jgi:hypothetical protein
LSPLPALPAFVASLAASSVAEARGGAVVSARPPRLIRRGILFRRGQRVALQTTHGLRHLLHARALGSLALRAELRGALKRLLPLLRPVRGGVGCLGETGGDAGWSTTVQNRSIDRRTRHESRGEQNIGGPRETHLARLRRRSHVIRRRRRATHVRGRHDVLGASSNFKRLSLPS